MTKEELARRLAERKNVSAASAADQLDRVVTRILEDLRNGKAAKLPGLGRLTRKQDSGIQFEREDAAARKTPKK